MVKYNVVQLQVDQSGNLDLGSTSRTEKDALANNNAIYVYHGSTSNKVYIGQTKHFIKRNNEHYRQEEKFKEASFDEVIVIFSQYFNRSALDDVEKQLITYFNADYSGRPGQPVSFDNDRVINLTEGNTVSGYAGQEDVASEVILPVWLNVLFKQLHWVSTETIDELRTSQLVKYSPIKTLSDEQEQIITEIIDNPNTNYLINGDAGTGKTVLLTNLVARLLQQRSDARIGVVVQPNWEKTAVRIFNIYGINTNNLFIGTSTKIINDGNQYDVIVVDEAHKLSSRYGKQHPSFNEVYEKPEYQDCKNHLEILQKMGKQIVLMYDVLQAIRPANINRKDFQNLTRGYTKKYLTAQLRIQPGAGTPEDYVNGIKYLLYKDTGLLDSDMTVFNPNFNHKVFNDTSEDDGYFGYFTEQPLHQMIDWLDQDRNFHQEHVNRILAGLCEPWKQSDGKDPAITHWHEGDLNLRWNSTQENWINSKEKDAREQVGSVFAVQGVDLNKVGVLIGNDLEVHDHKLQANPNHFYNTNGTFTKEEMELPENQFEFTLFVLNIYYVLLTRGIDGIRIGFWKNDSFREYMEETLDIHAN
ncbi:DNA/RNA helicase domain-containing protein [Bifidobacterium thermacidophilum]|uniref:DUF2075 domain-containing protein n=1 Tax=Bifidobacterium thermacidophilum TaxID=246618 RepID=UPI003F0D4A66